MSFNPGIEQQELLADTLRRPQMRMSSPERLADWLIGVGFILAAVALWMLAPPHTFSLWPAALCVGLVTLATFVRFDTPFGFTVVTQLAFVPLLFALPAPLVPPAVLLALLLARLPALMRGRMDRSRLLQVIGNSWFAIGPAAVFVLAHTPPAEAGPGLLLAALGAQFAVDFAASCLRYRISHGASIRSQLQDVWVYGIDAALSGVGLVVAVEAERTPVAPLALLPLLGLLAIFARERRVRLEALIELNGAYRGTALVLGDVVEADDGYTGEHSRGVVALSLELGRRLGLSAEEQRNLEFGALLHDVGKIATPKEIIKQAGRSRPERVDRRQNPYGRRPAAPGHGRGPHARGRPDRPLTPPALGWSRLPGRARRRADPSRGSHRGLLRHLERDAHRSPLSQGSPLRAGRGRARSDRRQPARPPHRADADRDGQG